jgi:CRISPR-associated exonuclease Cas4
MYYTDDDMLMLSGIQHYMFCPRQWALIHVEQLWRDNQLTAEGDILHERVDDPFYREKNGKTITLRSVRIASHELGLYGITDAVELLPMTEGGIAIERHPGQWSLFPIEYKRGKRKPDERDEVQLAAQVLCLEEMHGIHIPQAALFYHETMQRELIDINEELRSLTRQCAEDMHRLFNDHITPAAQYKPSCRRCSLIDICLPTLPKRQEVRSYLKNNLYEETAEHIVCDDA